MGSSPHKGSSKGRPAAKSKGGSGKPALAKGSQGGAARPPAGPAAKPRQHEGAMRIAWWALLALVFLVPLVISNMTWTKWWMLPFTYDQFDIAKVFVMRSLTLVAASAWAWHVLVKGGSVRFVGRGGEGRFRFFTWFEFLVLAMLTWLALTTLTSIHPPTALFGKYRRFEGLISFVNYVVVFFLALQLADRPSRIRTVLITVFMSNIFVSGYAVLQYFGSVPFDVAAKLLQTTLRLAALGPLIAAGLNGLADGWHGKRFGPEVWAGLVAAVWFVGVSAASFAGLVGWAAVEWVLLLVAFSGGTAWVFFSLPEESRGAFAGIAATVVVVALGAAWLMSAFIANARAAGAEVVSLDLIRWGDLPFEANRGFATYGNPDLLGGFLMFPLTISLALALSEKEWRWRALYWAGALLTIVAWITAFVRGSWIGGVVGLIAFAIAVPRSGIKARKVDWVFVGLAVLVVVAVVSVSLQSPSGVLNIGDRLASIFRTDEGSALTRTQIWKAAWDATLDKPLVGFGLDTFRLVFPKYKPYEYVAAAGYLSVADNVHNYPLQLAAGVGVVGFLLVYGCFFVAAWLALAVAYASGGGEQRLLQAGIWAACAAYVAHLVFGLSVTGSTVFMWLCMGLLLSPVARTVEMRAPSWGVYAAAGIAALCVVLLAGNVVYVVADSRYLDARISTRGMDRVSAIEEAIRLNPTNDMYRSELGLAYQDIAVNSVFQGRDAQQRGEDPGPYLQQGMQAVADAERALKAAIDFVPTEYDNYVFIANLYNFAGDYLDPNYRDQAIEWAKKGVDVEPYGPAIRYQLAVAYAGKGETTQAIEAIEPATEMDYNYTEAFALLGDMYRQQGRTPDALEAYARGLYSRPEDAQVRSLADDVLSGMLAEGKEAEAVARLEKVLADWPWFAWGSLRLGERHASAGRHDEAAEVFRDAIVKQQGTTLDPASLEQLRAALASLETTTAGRK